MSCPLRAELVVKDQQPEEEKVKEINSLNFFKHRVDKNTMKALFMCLPGSPQIHTLKSV